MQLISKQYPIIILSGLLAVVAGCGSSGSDPAQETGSLSLAVSDGPIHNATKVCITFDEIEIKGSGASTVVALDPPEKVNLLDFQGKNAAPILSNHELPAGQYQWMRLGVDAVRGSNGGAGDTGGVECDGVSSYIAMEGGSTYNLYVPSGAQTGLKLVGGFMVPANGSANFTAEFDLMKSLNSPVGQAPDVMLKPAVRLVNNIEAGTLVGMVSGDLAGVEGCDPSVFVFNDGVTPNAIEDDVENPDDPVATAMVNAEIDDAGETEYSYSVGYLTAGEYEAAFTCDGAVFEPADGKGASISANVVTTLDFP